MFSLEQLKKILFVACRFLAGLIAFLAVAVTDAGQMKFLQECCEAVLWSFRSAGLVVEVITRPPLVRLPGDCRSR
jgi:hypothetical protein